MLFAHSFVIVTLSMIVVVFGMHGISNIDARGGRGLMSGVIRHHLLLMLLFVVNHTVFDMVCIVHHSLLSEVEGFEVFAAMAVTPIDQAKEATSRGVRSVSTKVHVAILLNELIYCQVAATDTDYYLVFFNLHKDSLLSILVDTFGLTFKPHFVSQIVGHVVDKQSKFLIKWVVLDRVVYECILGHICVVLELHDYLMKAFYLTVTIFQMRQELNRGLLGLLTLFLNLKKVVSTHFQVVLVLIFCIRLFFIG